VCVGGGVGKVQGAAEEEGVQLAWVCFSVAFAL
jgi:hypothetical protein